MSENIFTHSAEVDMLLDCGQYGQSQLSRITPKSVELREPFDAPPCDGTLIVTVDGQTIRRQVRVSRISRNRSVAIISPVAEVAPF